MVHLNHLDIALRLQVTIADHMWQKGDFKEYVSRLYDYLSHTPLMGLQSIQHRRVQRWTFPTATPGTLRDIPRHDWQF